MKTRKRILMSALLVFLASTIHGQVPAAEPAKTPTLGTVVVTAGRTEELIERTPASVSVIDAEDIAHSNAENVVDLLRHVQGVVVRDVLGNGKNAQVDLRGFGETGAFNTLVLVDGRRVNAMDLSGVDWTQIPIEQVERIEIVRGAGSVLYGDNAVGGVINIITKIPSQKFFFDAGAAAGSYGKNKEQVSIGGGSDNLLLSLSAAHDFTGGYRDNGEFRSKDLAGKVIFDPFDRLSLTLRGSWHADDFGLPGTLTEAEVREDPKATDRPYDEGESSDRYLQIGFEVDLGKYGRLISDLAYRNREIDSEFRAFTSVNETDTETRSITPRYIWEGDLAGFSDRLVAGIDLYRTEQDGESYFGAPLSLSGLSDTQRNSYGFYLRNELYLQDNLILSLGARREKVKYDLHRVDYSSGLAPLEESITDRESAYSAGLTYLYGDRSSVFARVNRSFRFPLTDEVVVFDFFAGRIDVNRDIKPQAGNHYELGLKHHFTSRIQAGVTLFRAEIDDEIFFNPATFANQNHPETLHQGVELGGRADLIDHATLFANYTYTRATFEAEPFKGQDIPAVPRHRANLGVRIYELLPGLSFSAEYDFVGDSYAVSDQANAFDKLDDYYTVNARVAYKWDCWQAFLGVNNITDQEYSEYAVIGGFPAGLSFYPAPATTWLAGLRISF